MKKTVFLLWLFLIRCTPLEEVDTKESVICKTCIRTEVYIKYLQTGADTIIVSESQFKSCNEDNLTKMPKDANYNGSCGFTSGGYYLWWTVCSPIKEEL